jgi:hypothetical protein
MSTRRFAALEIDARWASNGATLDAGVGVEE